MSVYNIPLRVQLIYKMHASCKYGTYALYIPVINVRMIYLWYDMMYAYVLLFIAVSGIILARGWVQYLVLHNTTINTTACRKRNANHRRARLSTPAVIHDYIPMLIITHTRYATTYKCEDREIAIEVRDKDDGSYVTYHQGVPLKHVR